MLRLLTTTVAMSSVFFLTEAIAQENEFSLVWVSSQPEVTRTGAFMSVCIDPVAGLAVLKERASDIQWGAGSTQSPKNAASMFPYFSTPALVTADCLEEMLSEYRTMFGRDDLTVKSLN